jgi:hypothetical protein
MAVMWLKPFEVSAEAEVGEVSSRTGVQMGPSFETQCSPTALPCLCSLRLEMGQMG